MWIDALGCVSCRVLCAHFYCLQISEMNTWKSCYDLFTLRSYILFPWAFQCDCVPLLNGSFIASFTMHKKILWKFMIFFFLPLIMIINQHISEFCSHRSSPQRKKQKQNVNSFVGCLKFMCWLLCWHQSLTRNVQ